MILELLKLKTLVAARLVERGEAVMVKRYERKERAENQLKSIQAAAPRTLTIDDIEEVLARNSGVTLQIDGREVSISPSAASTLSGRQQAGSEPITSSLVVISGASEDGTDVEAAVAETLLETKVVPEPTDELLSDINSSFEDVSFSASEVDEIIANLGKPKNVVTTTADRLPAHNGTMTLAKISISRPDEDEEILTGTFISSSIFSGCGDVECTSCGEGGEDEDGAIILHYVSDEGTTRCVNTIELEPALVVTLAL